MAWERSFERKVMVVRDKELKYQRLNYIIEVRPNLSTVLTVLTAFCSDCVQRYLVSVPCERWV